MPIKSRHFYIGPGSLAAAAAAVLDLSSAQSAIVYHGGACDIEGSGDGGTTWQEVVAAPTGAGATVISPAPGLMRITNTTAGALEYWVEGIRGID